MKNTKSIGELAKIYKGKKAENVFEDKRPNAVRYLQIEDLRPDSRKKYTHKNGGFIATEKDILIAWDGANAGTVNFGLDGFIGSTIAALRLKDKDSYPPFIGRFLQSKFDYLRENCTGATIPHINRDILQNLSLQIPTPDEQKRIAAILDKADRLRRQRRFAQTLSDSFLQSVFIKMFGEPLSNSMNWKTEFLGNLFSIPPHIGTITPAESEGEQICVRVGEVGGDYIDLKNCQYVTLTGNELKRFSLHFGDIVLARAIGSESHLGKLSVMTHSSKPVVFDSHLMRLRLNNSLLLTPFFTQMLKTKGGRARFMKQARRTAVQFNINGEQISELEIPIPPLPLQEKFAEIVQKFERVRRQQREATRQAEHLFQTLLHRAFRGEL